mmetsp:Transcript_131940/g.329081  ORF Transcript_131940/g.329081 Transcript_131940/m.329081 type:complete len:208 (+) Transcript_131940:155-778(+)
MVRAVKNIPPEALRIDVVCCDDIGSAPDTPHHEHRVHIRQQLCVEGLPGVLIGFGDLLGEVDTKAVQRSPLLFPLALPSRPRAREGRPEVDVADVMAGLQGSSMQEPPLVATCVEGLCADGACLAKLLRHANGVRNRFPGALSCDGRAGDAEPRPQGLVLVLVGLKEGIAFRHIHSISSGAREGAAGAIDAVERAAAVTRPIVAGLV